MKMNGEFRVPSDKQTVWEALNDPAVLKDCLPGCEEIEKTSDTEMTAKLTIKVGPVKAKFAGGVTLSDLDPPNGYTLTGKGQGGAAGFASGVATVKLTEDGGETVLSYDVDAKVGGKLAQIGSRLIDSTSKKLAQQFFDKLAERLGDGADAAAEQPEPAAEPEPAPAAEPAPAEAAAPEPAAPEAKPAEAAPQPAAPAAASPAPPASKSSAPPPPPPAAARHGLPIAFWVGSVIIIAIILILVFTGVI